MFIILARWRHTCYLNKRTEAWIVWEIESSERVDVLLWRNRPNQPGIIFLELGLCWASPGLSCSVSAYETTSAHLCHSTATEPPSPSSSHLSPIFLQSSPLLHCFKCKINIKPRSRTIFRPVSAELEPSVKPVVPLSRPRSMQEWFSPFVPCLRRRGAELMLFRLSLSEGLILSHLLAVLQVFTLCSILYVWCF